MVLVLTFTRELGSNSHFIAADRAGSVSSGFNVFKLFLNKSVFILIEFPEFVEVFSVSEEVA
jgi:hypothetical protein